MGNYFWPNVSLRFSSFLVCRQISYILFSIKKYVCKNTCAGGNYINYIITLGAKVIIESSKILTKIYCVFLKFLNSLVILLLPFIRILIPQSFWIAFFLYFWKWKTFPLTRIIDSFLTFYFDIISNFKKIRILQRILKYLSPRFPKS